MPIAIPTPNATTTIPHPAVPPSESVLLTKIGPIARTAPTAANAMQMPPVMAEAIESSRRNRTPSPTSRHTRDRSYLPIERLGGVRIGTPLTISAENANVAASSRSANVSGLAMPTHVVNPAISAKIAPPSGSVP